MNFCAGWYADVPPAFFASHRSSNKPPPGVINWSKVQLWLQSRWWRYFVRQAVYSTKKNFFIYNSAEARYECFFACAIVAYMCIKNDIDIPLRLIVPYNTIRLNNFCQTWAGCLELAIQAAYQPLPWHRADVCIRKRSWRTKFEAFHPCQPFTFQKLTVLVLE